MQYTPTKRGRYLRAVPPAHRIQERLSELQKEAEQLNILLRLARDLDRVDGEGDTTTAEDRQEVSGAR